MLRSTFGIRCWVLGVCRLKKSASLFPAYEKFLARETGTILLFVVGLHERSRNELDRSAQLRGAK
jgi:hypothetical protein